MAVAFVENVALLNEKFKAMQKKLANAALENTILKLELAKVEDVHSVSTKKAFDEGLDMGERGALGCEHLAVLRTTIAGSSSCSARRWTWRTTS